MTDLSPETVGDSALAAARSHGGDVMTDADIIAAFRERLLAGAFGDRELLVPSELAFSGMWSGLCDELVRLEDRFGRDNPVVHEVRTAVYRLADQRPDAVKVFALATTRYGREQEMRA